MIKFKILTWFISVQHNIYDHEWPTERSTGAWFAFTYKTKSNQTKANHKIKIQWIPYWSIFSCWRPMHENTLNKKEIIFLYSVFQKSFIIFFLFVSIYNFDFPVLFFIEKYSLIVCITQNKMSIAIYSTHTINNNHTNVQNELLLIVFFLSRSKIPFNFRISDSSNKSISWHQITCNLTFVPQFPASVKMNTHKWINQSCYNVGPFFRNPFILHILDAKVR